MIKESDVKITFIRGSGPGGQRKNKVSTGVRLVHVPTGIAIEAVEEREQSKNRAMAFQRLETRLKDLAAERRAAAKRASHKAKPKASFGTFMRNYRLVHPSGVTDSLTGHTDPEVQAVLNGHLEGFLTASLRSRSQGTA